MSDPARRLLRALARAAAAAGCAPVLRHDGTDPWASVTFTGARHRVTATGTGLAAWLAALPEAELPLPAGHLVAGCAVTPTASGAVLELLVLDC